MDLLARREHSRFEMERKLRVKGFDQAHIPSALNQLVKQDLLSDSRFAEQYCWARSQRGFGPRRIQLELQDRGVSPELIEDTLREISRSSWIKLAKATWKKKFSGKIASDYQTWAKQRRFLQYRGYTDEQSEWLSYENE